jgi:hypothetical protein
LFFKTENGFLQTLVPDHGRIGMFGVNRVEDDGEVPVGTMVRLTRYVMPIFEFREEFPGGPDSSFLCVFQALADSFPCVCLRGNVEQALISLGILYDSGCFSLDGQNDGASAFFELHHEFAGSTAECRQRLDVFGDIEHSPGSI